MSLWEGGRIDGHEVKNRGYHLGNSFSAKEDMLFLFREEASKLYTGQFPGSRTQVTMGGTG